MKKIRSPTCLQPDQDLPETSLIPSETLKFNNVHTKEVEKNVLLSGFKDDAMTLQSSFSPEES